MTNPESPAVLGVIVERELRFTLVELSHACDVDATRIIALVEEGVLPAAGDAPDQWWFEGVWLRRARRALRLSEDLHLDAAGTAVVLDLLDEVERLRAQLRAAGVSASAARTRPAVA